MSINIDKLLKVCKHPRPQDVEDARYRKEHKDELRAEAKRKLKEHRKRRLGL